jgi:hypothetical protein
MKLRLPIIGLLITVRLPMPPGTTVVRRLRFVMRLPELIVVRGPMFVRANGLACAGIGTDRTSGLEGARLGRLNPPEKFGVIRAAE